MYLVATVERREVTVGRVARTAEMRNLYKVWPKRLKVRERLEDRFRPEDNIKTNLKKINYKSVI
jgi:hypothetical protein